MQAYEIIQSFAYANPYDTVIVTDGEKEYEINYIRTDNGFVEMNIKEKEEKK